MSKSRKNNRVAHRAQFWDYSNSGLYFITILAKDKKCIFGEIVNQEMICNEYGQIVVDEINKLPEYNPRVKVDEWIVMPNHIHIIIGLRDGEDGEGHIDGDGHDHGGGDGGDDGDGHGGGIDVREIHEFPLRQNPHHDPKFIKYRLYRRRMLLPKILGKFKHQTSKNINVKRNTPGTGNWQIDYYDHIIRNEQAYLNIKRYIINNPRAWKIDKLYNQQKSIKIEKTSFPDIPPSAKNSSFVSMSIQIYTDGSALGNPGPGGYGAILRFQGKEKVLSEGFRLTTNNRMELLAVIVALEAIKTNKHPVTIYSDSKYVVDSVEKRWVFGWQKTGFKDKKNVDLWKRYLPLHQKFSPKFVWVKGHAGHPENERCDELAVSAAQGNNLKIDEGYENQNESNLFE